MVIGDVDSDACEFLGFVLCAGLDIVRIMHRNNDDVEVLQLPMVIVYHCHLRSVALA